MNVPFHIASRLKYFNQTSVFESVTSAQTARIPRACNCQTAVRTTAFNLMTLHAGMPFCATNYRSDLFPSVDRKYAIFKVSLVNRLWMNTRQY